VYSRKFSKYLTIYWSERWTLDIKIINLINISHFGSNLW
jgi:hypothetical protein